MSDQNERAAKKSGKRKLKAKAPEGGDKAPAKGAPDQEAGKLLTPDDTKGMTAAELIELGEAGKLAGGIHKSSDGGWVSGPDVKTRVIADLRGLDAIPGFRKAMDTFFGPGGDKTLPDMKPAEDSVSSTLDKQDAYAKAVESGDLQGLADEGTKAAQGLAKEVKIDEAKKSSIVKAAEFMKDRMNETAAEATSQISTAMGAAMSQGAKDAKSVLDWSADYIHELGQDIETGIKGAGVKDIALGALRMVAPVALVGGAVAAGLSMPWMAGFPTAASAINATFLTAGVPVLAAMGTIRGDIAKDNLSDPILQGPIDQWSNKALSQLSPRTHIVEGGKQMMKGLRQGWSAFRKAREPKKYPGVDPSEAEKVLKNDNFTPDWWPGEGKDGNLIRDLNEGQKKLWDDFQAKHGRRRSRRRLKRRLLGG